MELLALGADKGFGGLELVGPIEGKGGEDTQIAVRGSGGEVGDWNTVDQESLLQLVPNSAVVCGAAVGGYEASMVVLVQDGSDCHFVRVGGQACPGVVQVEFVKLGFKVGDIGAKDGQVICIGCHGELVLIVLGWGEAAKAVASAALMQPAEEGFHEDEEEEGREVVALDTASSHRDGLGGSPVCENGGVGTSIEVLNDIYGVCRVTHIIHDLEQFVVADGVEGTAEVYIEGVEVLFGEGCILGAVNEVHELSVGVFPFAEAFLGGAEEVVAFSEVGEDPSEVGGPELIEGVGQANGAVVGGVCGGFGFVKQDGVGVFPGGGGGAQNPHEDKDVVDGVMHLGGE